MPEEVQRLIHVIRIKMLAKLLFIGKVMAIDGRYRFTVGKDESGREYQLPEDFADRVLRALFEIQRNLKKGRRLLFLKDGFEFSTQGMQSEESMYAVEKLLIELSSSLQG
jgi:hypothetical protein